jgi:serine/threonine protein kinase/tetratricopeptide (TPR) repeat protein
MATTVSAQLCSICGKPLGRRGKCVVCLLSAGLEHREIEEELDPFAFEGFEIQRREDGSLWELGRGAMGVTYRALDKTLHRNVALKVIDTPQTGESRSMQNRFLREARAAAALRHPNIAGVFHFGALSDRCYYAMELVEGETLEARARRDGPLPVHLALEIAIQVTQALSAAAAQGLVHRDLKPGNIMLAGDEATAIHAKVIDFGLAKATADTLGEMDLTQGGFVGTPTFASPEQFDRTEVDPRSDIYSLGATIWFALTGLPPFSGQTVEAIRNNQKNAPLPVGQLRARKVPAPVITLLRRTLAADPTRRPASARELMELLQSIRRRLARHRTVTSISTWALPIAVVIVGIATFLILYFPREKAPAPPGPVTEKSIAVLPFENLSEEKENAFFADGLQDDILTTLGKVSDLKVISRTSVSQYRGAGAARNLRGVARELGVENVLEGSVRRAGNRVLVNVQLIDARNDRHIWAERYDRTMADSIGLQGELAEQIATALRAKLPPEQKGRLDLKPTENPDAYAFYLEAIAREKTVNSSTEDKVAAEQLYAQAIARDPKFALAHARLSIVNSELGEESSDNRGLKAKARSAAEKAIYLAPSLGEAHMALGLSLYWADKNYAAALKEFSTAARTLPNDPEVLHYLAGIYRRQGRWRESLGCEARALDLDPRNLEVTLRAAIDHLLVRNWAAVTAYYNRALEIAPDSAVAKAGLAYLEIYRNSNPAAARKILQAIPADVDPNGLVTSARWDLATLERDYTAAEKILTDFSLDAFPTAEGAPKIFYLGRTALARGDIKSGQRYLEAARPDIEAWVREEPDDPNRHAQLGLLYAYLGRKEEAIREARQAVEMVPESQNAFHGSNTAASLALAYSLVGESDQAITLIERLLTTPGPVNWPDFPNNITLADLRLRWEWDGLRSDPRFQKLVAGPEPKTIY